RRESDSRRWPGRSEARPVPGSQLSVHHQASFGRFADLVLSSGSGAAVVLILPRFDVRTELRPRSFDACQAERNLIAAFSSHQLSACSEIVCVERAERRISIGYLFGSSFFMTRPPFITKLTPASSPMSFNGSP